MDIGFFNNITWAKTEPGEVKAEPFKWGTQSINPGYAFDKIGAKQRSSFGLSVNLIYCGRNGQILFFQPEGEPNENIYIVLNWVSPTVLLAQTSKSGFYDIRY